MNKTVKIITIIAGIFTIIGVIIAIIQFANSNDKATQNISIGGNVENTTVNQLNNSTIENKE